MSRHQSSSKAITVLISQMEEGAISYSKSEKALREIAEKYETPFFPTRLPRKNPPWDKRYLKELTSSARHGASRDDLLHIAKVSDYVYRWKHRLITFGRILFWCVIGAAAVAAAVSFLLWLKRR